MRIFYLFRASKSGAPPVITQLSSVSGDNLPAYPVLTGPRATCLEELNCDVIGEAIYSRYQFVEPKTWCPEMTDAPTYTRRGTVPFNWRNTSQHIPGPGYSSGMNFLKTLRMMGNWQIRKMRTDQVPMVSLFVTFSMSTMSHPSMSRRWLGCDWFLDAPYSVRCDSTFWNVHLS